MLILGKDQMKDPSLGYARTFVRQAEDCLGLALERGVRIVATPAASTRPASPSGWSRWPAASGSPRPSRSSAAMTCAPASTSSASSTTGSAARSPPTPTSAPAASPTPSTAGADVVVTGRVTDASLVVGPAIAHFGWDATAYDELAGATVAGHVLECGTQATGGNFSGFRALLADGPADAWTRPLGFPLAEIEADGSCVITKHDGTGGAVTVDTVTAQLMYEVQGPTYLGPDVSTHLDSVRLCDDGPDRVRVSGVRGSAPPATLKVCLNFLGGFRNSAELVLVGLDVDAKAAWVRAQVDAALAPRRPAAVEWSLARTDREDADTEEGASCRLRVTVRDPDAAVVGKAFTAPLVELALGSYPGFTLTAPPAPATPYAVYRPGYVPRDTVAVGGTVHLLNPSVVEERRACGAASRHHRSWQGWSRDARLRSLLNHRRRHGRDGARPAGARRARPVRRQGRRRQHRSLGGRRRHPTRPGRLACRDGHPRRRTPAGARGRRARRRGAPAAQPRRRQRRACTASSATGWRRRAASTRRPRRSASGSARATSTSRRCCCERLLERGAGGAARDGAGVRAQRGRPAPAGLGGRRRGAARSARQGREARAARPRRARGPRRQRRHLPRRARRLGGVHRGGRLQRPARRPLHQRHRAAAHRRHRRSRPRRPVRPADPRRREDRRARDHRARRRLRRRAAAHDRPPRGRPLRRGRRQDLHHLRRAGRLRHRRGARPAAPATPGSACSWWRRARPASR